MNKHAGHIVIILCFLMLPGSVWAQLNKERPKDLQGVDIEEKLGDTIPLDLTFANTSGDSITLGELLQNDKPVLLNPVYYDCPMLCSLVMEAVYKGIEDLEWSPGKDYNVITFSIDPEEDHKLAATGKDSLMQRFNRDGAEEGWHFLTGKQEAIEELTDAIGFKYKKIEETGEFAHGAGIMFLSPDGVLTRYLYGLEYDEFQMRNALYEAADGDIGSTTEQIVLSCYQYDPDSQSYSAVAWRIMRLGGFATVLILGIFLGFLWLKEKKSPKKDNKT